ncbi:MAG: bifunctional folylpolyglutamate synthase/dihydrofolate synthase, partial [Clostridia bacterium]|nr:bifunctional folylpolyglutamate synthase/dihydrofolate synthase [Clostridia bacterium]
MKYEEALRYISTTNRFGEKNGLSGIARLCEKLGNPQNNLKCVHIAGTNGKGSTATYIAEILKLSGYKTGLFTSPFIYEFNERIKINGQNISDDELADCMTEVKLKIDELINEGYPHPTEFEIITATAFLYYNMKKCDVVVLEVGLGGRFDSTNIIKEPLCSV